MTGSPSLLLQASNRDEGPGVPAPPPRCHSELLRHGVQAKGGPQPHLEEEVSSLMGQAATGLPVTLILRLEGRLELTVYRVQRKQIQSLPQGPEEV